MTTAPHADAHVSETAALRRVVAEYQRPVLQHSLSQIASSFGGFFAVCLAMYLILPISVWPAVALAPLAAGFLVRIFIIQHDCGHGAFFRSRRANDYVGRACSLLTLTPYTSWRRQHAGHHRLWNDLDHRDTGADIYSSCLTVAEYRKLPRRKRFWHRLARHPLVAHVVLPPLVFLVLYRVPFDTPREQRRARRGVYLTDLALAAAYGGLGSVVGFGPMAAVQGPVLAVAAIVGVWLFAVQHRFETTWWGRHSDWQFGKAALHGSSFLRLPCILRWFTGNIGYHHVHHLNSCVPNYALPACHARIANSVRVPTLTLRDGLRASRYVLWDEAQARMVTFRAAAS